MLKCYNISPFLPNSINIGSLIQKLALVNNMLVPLIPTSVVNNLVPVDFIHLLEFLKLVQFLLELLEPLVGLILHC